MSCQKCRTGILIEDSIAALSPSAYDFITSSHLAESAHPNQFKLPNHFQSRNTAVPRANPIRVTNSPADGRMEGRFGLGGGNESFVVLTESVVRPARLATATTVKSIAPEEEIQPISNLLQLSKLSELLSKKTAVDHPICTECTTILLNQLNAELANLTLEKEKLSGFLKDFKARRELSVADGISRESLMKEIAKLKKAEVVAKSELVRIEEERNGLKKEREQLELEEAELALEEEE